MNVKQSAGAFIITIVTTTNSRFFAVAAAVAVAAVDQTVVSVAFDAL